MCILSAYSAILRQTAALRPTLLLCVLAACLLFPCQNADAYTLNISSRPSNAIVFLNDKRQGLTPLAIKNLKRGNYALRLEKTRYETYETRLTIAHDDARLFTLSLLPTPTPRPTATPTPRPTITPRPTRTPTPRPPTPTPTPSQVLKLMQKANEYFNKKWYLTPEETNAFDVYKEILGLHPTHKLAKERIFEMMNQYKVWGDNNYDEADYDKAATYYERYMLIADYVLNTLQDQSILPEYKEIEARLAQAQNPPTPTPIATPTLSPSPTPMPTPTPTPTVTPTPTPLPTTTPTPSATLMPTPLTTATPSPAPTPLPTVTPTPSRAPDVEVPLARLIQRPGKLFVVIIGLDAYQDGRLPQRPGMASAAQELHELFHSPFSGGLDADQLQLLLNEDATARNVKRVLGTWLRWRVTEEDTVALFYGGYVGVEDEQGYWLPVETQADDLFSTALSYSKIADMLTRLESKHLLLLLDACAPEMSEQPPARENLIDMLQDEINAEKLILLNASGKRPCAAQPFFSAALVQGLEGQADRNGDGVIDLAEIWDYLKIKVIQRALASGGLQIPQKIGTALPHLPLTYKRAVLQARFHKERFQRRVDRLIDLYQADDISATQFEKAFITLQSQQHDQILEDFLNGKLPLEIFRDTF